MIIIKGRVFCRETICCSINISPKGPELLSKLTGNQSVCYIYLAIAVSVCGSIIERMAKWK